jgi:hypothetical protein
MSSSFAAVLSKSGMVIYMADVIALFLDGRLNWTCTILLERSVTMWVIALLQPSIPNAGRVGQLRSHAGLQCRHL